MFGITLFRTLPSSSPKNRGKIMTSLRTFADIADQATQEELKSLIPMFIERIVYHQTDENGQGVIDVSLFERPVRAEKSGTNLSLVMSAQCSGEYPRQDLNLQPPD